MQIILMERDLSTIGMHDSFDKFIGIVSLLVWCVRITSLTFLGIGRANVEDF